MNASSHARTIQNYKCDVVSHSNDMVSQSREDIFIKWEGTYQRELIQGRFVFLAFWAAPDARTPDKLNGTFFEMAQVLASEPSSLANSPPADETRVQDKAKGQNVCTGWYDTVTRRGGWCSVVVVPNTGPGYPFGTDSIRNDGYHWTGDNWQSTTWPPVDGYAVTVAYAENDGTVRDTDQDDLNIEISCAKHSH